MGRDHPAPSSPPPVRSFQPTRPYGARRDPTRNSKLCKAVSTHAPLWGATSPTRSARSHFTGFNPRAPMGRDVPPSDVQGMSATGFQPTRPYGARLVPERRRNVLRAVSTHAPLWGATHASHLFVIDITVSTHAPLWGATMASFVSVCLTFGFNPRAPMGRDAVAVHVARTQDVSTHAPLWGATVNPCMILNQIA